VFVFDSGVKICCELDISELIQLMFLCKNDALGLAYTTVIALSPKFIGMH